MRLSSGQRNEVLFSLAKYVATHRKEPVSVWGNVARGTIEAAAIHSVFERTGISSSFHLFRRSSHAFHDSTPVSIGEPEHHNLWAIAVDTFSMGGPSMPLTRQFLQSLEAPQSSVYLTFGGQHWDKRMPVQFRSPLWRRSQMGILLKDS